MAEKPSITGFFRNILGFGDTKSETVKNDYPIAPSITPLAAHPSNQSPNAGPEPGKPAGVKQPLASAGPNNPSPKTQAYQNRKQGRKQHKDSVEDLRKIIACIQNRGEVTPGELAKELGMARSSLTYNLNRLLTHSGNPEVKSKFSNPYLLRHLLGSRRIERLGAGPSLRYRIVEVPQAGSPMEPAQSIQRQVQEDSK